MEHKQKGFEVLGTESVDNQNRLHFESPPNEGMIPDFD